MTNIEERLRAYCLGGGSIPDEACACLTHRAAAKIELLEAELAALKTDTYCAYCGHRVPSDDDGSKVAEHIRTCPEHPMREAEIEIARLKETLEKINGD